MTTDTPLVAQKKYSRGHHPNSIKTGTANLIPYKPGQNGHKQTYSLANRLKHALDKPLKEPAPDAPSGEHIVFATLKGAIAAEPTFALPYFTHLTFTDHLPKVATGYSTLILCLLYHADVRLKPVYST